MNPLPSTPPPMMKVMMEFQALKDDLVESMQQEAKLMFFKPSIVLIAQSRIKNMSIKCLNGVLHYIN